MKDEERLIKEAKAGNCQAFSLIYQKYGKQIFSFIYWRTSDIHLAEDILQDVFLKAWNNIKTYKIKGGSIKAWLYRIARNTVIDYYRVKKQTISLDDVSFELASSETKATELVDLKIELKKIKKAINFLPDIQKEVIILKFIEELSNKEVSKILNKSEGAIRIIQFRALKKLKEFLKDKNDIQ